MQEGCDGNGAGGCIADFDGNPKTADECRDQFQLPGGMSEADCCLMTGNTGFYCGEGVHCGARAVPELSPGRLGISIRQ